MHKVYLTVSTSCIPLKSWKVVTKMPLKVNRNSYIHKRMNLWSCILYLLMHLCNFTSFFCNLSTVLNIICIRYTYATITLIALYSQVWNWDKLLKFISFSRLLFLNISSQLVCSLLKKGAMQTPNETVTYFSISNMSYSTWGRSRVGN